MEFVLEKVCLRFFLRLHKKLEISLLQREANSLPSTGVCLRISI